MGRKPETRLSGRWLSCCFLTGKGCWVRWSQTHCLQFRIPGGPVSEAPPETDFHYSGPRRVQTLEDRDSRREAFTMAYSLPCKFRGSPSISPHFTQVVNTPALSDWTQSAYFLVEGMASNPIRDIRKMILIFSVKKFLIFSL